MVLNYTFLIVIIGTSILGIISGVLSTIMVLQKESLLADSLSHAALPGVILVFLLTHNKNVFVLLLGGFLASFLAMYLIYLFKKLKVVYFDSVMAIILSSFFGLGLVFMSISQKIPDAEQVGLRNFIFGQASAMNFNDVITIISISSILLLLIVILFKEIKLYIFDKSFMQISGFNTKFIQFVMFFLVITTIIIQIQIIGVILTSAMLVAPAVGALQWTKSFLSSILLSGFFGMIAAIIGTIISSSFEGISTGPIITIVICLIAIISILIAPQGIVRNRLKVKGR